MRKSKYTISDINNGKPLDSKLTALYYTENISKRGDKYVMCLCECGVHKELRASHVITGNTKSCYCLYGQKLKGVSKKFSVVNKYIHRCYVNMMNRCYDRTNKSYKDYGGNGVIVCEDWRNSYQIFLDWALLNGWKQGLQIDKDIKGDGKLYSPETCCFVTPKVNSNKRRNNIVIYLNNKRMSLKEACEFINCSYSFVYKRMRKGMSFEEATTRVKATVKTLEYNGVTKTITEWSKYLNIKSHTIGVRLAKGYPVDKVLSKYNMITKSLLP